MRTYTRCRDAIAAWLTVVIGSMEFSVAFSVVCFYCWTNPHLKEIFDAISSSYYQGVMLSVIMVGQAVLNRGSEARAIQDHNTLLAEVALLRQIIDREREIEDRLGIEDSNA